MKKNMKKTMISGFWFSVLFIGMTINICQIPIILTIGEKNETTIHSDEYYAEQLEKILNRPLKAETVSFLEYSTYLGSDSTDQIRGIAVDDEGCAYITGTTYSTDFPMTPGAFDVDYNGGGSDIFVCKLNAAGTALVYSTFLGGSGWDDGYAIAVDSAGCAYITGNTEDSTTDFVVTGGAIDTTINGYRDVFVCKLNADGSGLEYSTFLGGSMMDYGYNIAIDTLGYAYVTGITEDHTIDFPTTSGVINQTHNGNYDIFISKINPTGTTLVYSTFLGSTDYEYVEGLAIDVAGNAYITGYTDEGTFPTTVGAMNTSINGGYDAFVCKINPTATTLVYSTFLGGATSDDYAYDLAIDNSNCTYITGYTTSTDFPTTSGCIQDQRVNNEEVFICKLNDTGSGLIYSTYLGEFGHEQGDAIAVDSTGNAYVSGHTMSTFFPTTLGSYDTSNAGSYDVFLCKINPMCTVLEYSTFLGGSSMDEPNAIALDDTGNAYVAGYTYSNGFPSTSGAINETLNDDSDGFVSKLKIETELHPTADFSASATTITEGDTIQFTFTGSNGNDPTTLQWQFEEDKGNSTEVNPTHKYDAAGTYTAKLTVSDKDGDVATGSIEITVEADSSGDDTTDDDDDLSESNILLYVLIPIGVIGLVAIIWVAKKKSAKKTTKK